MRRSGLASVLNYFGLVAAFSLPFYVLAMLGPDLTKVLPIPLPISSLMIFVPFGVSLWLTHQEAGRRGVWDSLRRVFDIQRIREKGWLLPTFLLLPATLLLSLLIQRLFGQAVTLAAFSLPAVLLAFTVFFVGAIFEEIGWTLYALGRLQQHVTALNAALIVGLFWQAWHVIPHFQAHHSAEWIFWHCVRGVALRVLIVWLYNNAGRSLFTAISFHAVDNVGTFVWPITASSYDPLVFAAILWLLVLLVVWYWGSRTLTTRRMQADVLGEVEK